VGGAVLPSGEAKRRRLGRLDGVAIGLIKGHSVGHGHKIYYGSFETPMVIRYWSYTFGVPVGPVTGLDAVAAKCPAAAETATRLRSRLLPLGYCRSLQANP
jgi:hypothetical protein